MFSLLFLLELILIFFFLVRAEHEETNPVQISYVLEPFESIDDNTFFTNPHDNNNQEGTSSSSLSLSATNKEDALFGRNALRVDFQPVYQDGGSGGGLVEYDFGLVNQDRPHNCQGATHLSLWYKVLQQPLSVENKGGEEKGEESRFMSMNSISSSNSNLHLRIAMLDDSACDETTTDCSDIQNLQAFYFPLYSLENSQTNTDWVEIVVDLQREKSDPTIERKRSHLNLQHIRGWKIELSATTATSSASTAETDFEKEEGTTTALEDNMNATTISIAFDNLACVGDGSLLGAAFEKDMKFEDAVKEGTWSEQYFNSPLAEERTSAALLKRQDDDAAAALMLNYTIEQSETWGGYISFDHLAPGNAYYNLSQASLVSLQYDVTDGATPPGRAHLRVILLDKSDCHTTMTMTTEKDNKNNDETCDGYKFKNVEAYYSFHHILDNSQNKEEQEQVDIFDPSSLSSSSSSSSVAVFLESTEDFTKYFFSRPGWSGHVGNDQLDKEHIKGFRLELNVNSEGEIGSTVSGGIVLSKLSAVSSAGLSSGGDLSKCVLEEGIVIDFEGSYGETFEMLEYRSQDCCELCQVNENCLFAFTFGHLCVMASYLHPSSIFLANEQFDLETKAVYWKDSSAARGDFCDLCDCQAEKRAIDCRGKDLAIVPKTFSPPDSAFLPLLLDLRENPRLTLIGSGALSDIPDTLEELRLPLNLTYLAYENLKDMPSLKSITYEGPEDVGGGGEMEEETPASKKRPTNFISNSFQRFSNICCHRGEQVNASSSPSTSPSRRGIAFCDMGYNGIPGSDAVYEPFVELAEAPLLQEIRPSSSFMAEAAESAQMCAQYCTLIDSCNYFSYDARWNEAEHICHLHSGGGIPTRVCCDEADYAEIGSQLPGWTSGRVPRSRHFIDNARTLVDMPSLSVSEKNDFTSQYTLFLGSTPLRGAVWIEPVVASSTQANVTFSPSQVVLYGVDTNATVSVHVSNVEAAETIVIVNKIESCDSAFTAATSSVLADETNVYVSVSVSDQDMYTLLSSILIPVGVLLVVAASVMFFIVERRKQESDTSWKIDISELQFDDPPLVIGRGTFGLVVLAEYRGTRVAVKRVISLGTGKKMKRHNLFGKVDHTKDVEKDLSTSAMNTQSGISLREGPEDCVIKHTSKRTSCASQFTLESGFTEHMSAQTRRSSLQSRQWSFIKAIRLNVQDEQSIQQGEFLREIRILSRLRHPCIISIMGAVMSPREEPMLIMEYMDHGSLYDILHNETMAFEGEMIPPILHDIASGIRFLHAASPPIIHGDLKAANILVDSKFRAKVADFGLSQKNRIGISGSFFWMAPELLRKESSNTTATDVYSFGVILYEVYSRRDPYDNEEPSAVLTRIADPKMNYRLPVPPSCPDEIGEIMTRCFEGHPIMRPTFEQLDLKLRELKPDSTRLSFVQKEQPKLDRMSLETFPRHISQALLEGREVQPEFRDVVTVFFSDIVGFTTLSSKLPPMKVRDMLDRLYSAFDEVSDEHDVFKVETIGDAYLAVTNLAKDQPDHAKRIANFAIDVIRAANDTMVDVDDSRLGFVNIRVGLHSGPVVADVVGTRRPKYTLFGDTVNTASRMESNSQQNRIHASETTAYELQVQCPDLPLRYHGLIQVKGKGEMHTYWVNEYSSVSSFRRPIVTLPEQPKTGNTLLSAQQLAQQT